MLDLMQHPVVIGVISLLLMVVAYLSFFHSHLFYLVVRLTTRSLGYKQRFVKLKNGHTCSYAEKGEQHKETLLFLHGFSANTLVLMPLGRRFDNYRVICMDWLNHGFSSASESSHVQVEEVVQFVQEFVETFHGELGKVHIAGHSTGGYVAVKYAIQNPQNVASVTLLSPLGVEISQGNGDQWVYDMIYTKSSEQLLEFMDFVSNKKRKHVPSFLLPAITKTRYQKGDHHFAIWKGFVKDAKFTCEDMDKLSKTPCLLIWGGEDMVLPSESGVKFFRDNSPATEIQVLEGGSHMFVETEASETHQIMSKFIQRVQ